MSLGYPCQNENLEQASIYMYRGWSSWLVFCQFVFPKLRRTFTLVLLSPDIPHFVNSVDPDQLASEEAN